VKAGNTGFEVFGLTRLEVELNCI